MSTSTAYAQQPDPESTRRAAMRSLPIVCGDYAQLCPKPMRETLGPREMLICLKHHTVDVSLRCRHTLAQAQAQAQP